MPLEDFTICTYHNFTIGNLKQLKNKLKKSENPDTVAIFIIDDIIKDIRVAKKMGQRMENRMKKYRRAIESCGFTRAYPNNKK